MTHCTGVPSGYFNVFSYKLAAFVVAGALAGLAGYLAACQFGFVNPILVDRGGVVVAGHGRLAAAMEMGLKKVPVIKLGDLSDDQAKALRIADNSIAESGTSWDPDMLEAELASLRAVKFDLEPLGLDAIELPELEEIPTAPPPKPTRNKTTIFLSVKNADAEKARKLVAAALTKAKIEHNL